MLLAGIGPGMGHQRTSHERLPKMALEWTAPWPCPLVALNHGVPFSHRICSDELFRLAHYLHYPSRLRLVGNGCYATHGSVATTLDRWRRHRTKYCLNSWMGGRALALVDDRTNQMIGSGRFPFRRRSTAREGFLLLTDATLRYHRNIDQRRHPLPSNMAFQSDPRRPALHKIVGVLTVSIALECRLPARAAERQAARWLHR